MSKEEPLQSVFYNAVVLSELTNAPPAVNTNKHNTKEARGHNVFLMGGRNFK